MFTPQDFPGECNAYLHYLFVGGTQSEGTAIVRCNQSAGHDGLHKERFMRGDKPVEITWEIDERDYSIYEDCRVCTGWGLLTDDDGEPYGVLCDNCEGKGKLVVGDTRDKGNDYD